MGSYLQSAVTGPETPFHATRIALIMAEPGGANKACPATPQGGGSPSNMEGFLAIEAVDGGDVRMVERRQGEEGSYRGRGGW